MKKGAGRQGGGGFRRRPPSGDSDGLPSGMSPTQASGAPRRPIKEPPPLFPEFENLPMPAEAEEDTPDVYKKALHLVDYWRNSVYFLKNPEPKPEVVKYSHQFKTPQGPPLAEVLMPQYGHLFPEELQKASLSELRKRKAAAKRDGDDALKRLEREEGTQKDEDGTPKKKVATGEGDEEEKDDEEKDDDEDANALEDLDAEEFENEFQDDDDGAGDVEDGGDGEAVY